MKSNVYFVFHYYIFFSLALSVALNIGVFGITFRSCTGAVADRDIWIEYVVCNHRSGETGKGCI
jgi:hypothetical protein